MEHFGERFSCSWGEQGLCHWTLSSLGLHQPSWLEGSQPKSRVDALTGAWSTWNVPWGSIYWGEAVIHGGSFLPGQGKLKQQWSMEMYVHSWTKSSCVCSFVHFLTYYLKVNFFIKVVIDKTFWIYKVQTRQFWLQMSEILSSHSTSFLPLEYLTN